MNTFALMQLFPVEYSSLSATALLQLVIEQYDLDSASAIVFLKRGFNDTYLIISKGEKLVCRVYKHAWRNLETIENEINLLLYLKQNSTPVSVPIETKEKKWVLEIKAPEGVRHLVLFSYAPGQQVRKLSIDQSFLLGVETAKMHLLTKEKKIGATAQNYAIEKQFTQTIQVIEPILVDYPPQYQFVKKLQELFLKELNSINQEELIEGICHGDLQAENFHFDEKGKITFFDFDFFGEGYLIYDIAVFMWYDHKNKPPEIMNSFLRGYESKRSLTATERKFIPWLSTIRGLFQMTLYCRISDGKQLPLWPASEVAAFINKLERWHKEKIVSY